MGKIIGLLIVVILIGAGYMWWSGSLGEIVQTPAAPTTTVEETLPTDQATTTTVAPVNVLPTAVNDISDEALTTDTKSLDTQISGLQTDATLMNTTVTAPTGN